MRETEAGAGAGPAAEAEAKAGAEAGAGAESVPGANFFGGKAQLRGGIYVKEHFVNHAADSCILPEIFQHCTPNRANTIIRMTPVTLVANVQLVLCIRFVELHAHALSHRSLACLLQSPECPFPFTPFERSDCGGTGQRRHDFVPGRNKKFPRLRAVNRVLGLVHLASKASDPTFGAVGQHQIHHTYIC